MPSTQWLPVELGCEQCMARPLKGERGGFMYQPEQSDRQAFKIDSDELSATAARWGFQPGAVEKCLRMWSIAHRLHMRLPDHFMIRGGFGLNLFVLPAPRLSSDLDLVIVSSDPAARAQVIDALEQIIADDDYDATAGHLGQRHDKWTFVFDTQGERRVFSVDVLMAPAATVWPATPRRFYLEPALPALPVMAAEELAAEKMVALLRRGLSVDLFDACQIVRHLTLEPHVFRVAFAVAIATAWGPVPVASVAEHGWRAEALRNLPIHLVPSALSRAMAQDPLWSHRLVDGCVRSLAALASLGAAEAEFIAEARSGRVRTALMTSDPTVAAQLERLLSNHSAIARPIAPPQRTS